MYGVKGKTADKAGVKTRAPLQDKATEAQRRRGGRKGRKKERRGKRNDIRGKRGAA
jgi:hypothetical protein